MATIATAEVRIIADTRRFIPDLRRKLKAAFATLGNQLGDDIVDKFQSRINRRLDTIMQRAGKNSANEFSKAFDNSLKNAGLSASLREQLSNAGARRGAARAGDIIAEAFGDNFTGTLGRISDDALDSISFQAAAASAGRAGADTAQSFADNFRATIRSDLQNRINQDFADVIEDLGDSPQIPAVFRRMGESGGQSFVVGASTQFRDLNQGLFTAIAGLEADTDRLFEQIGINAGTAFSQSLTESVGDRVRREFREAVENATATGIPPIFRRMGNVSATTFVEEFTEEVDNSLTARFGRVFSRLGDRVANAAGSRAGTQFANGFINALRRIPAAFASLLDVVVARPLQGLAGIFGEMSSELLSVAGQMLAVVALLEALSGLLFSFPAAVSVAGAAIAAMIVPLKGIVEAFDTAGGPADEFEKSLEGLTPAAQSVVREFRAISPALTDLRLQAQAAFFADLDGAITGVAKNLLGPLSKGLASASGAFGRIVDQITEFLSQSETANTVAATFDALTAVFDAVAESTEPFLEGMRTLVDEFIPEIEELADPLSDMGDEFKDWAERITESGEAMEAFDRGKDTLQEIFDIALDITGIFDAMFDAAESVGIDALGAIGDAIADLREEFESVEGQDALGEVFDSLGRIAGSVGGVLSALFEALADLAPSVADLFEEVGPDIEDFIRNLGEGIQELIDSGGTDFIGELAEALGNIDFAKLGEGIGLLLATFAPILTVLDEIINFVLTLVNAIGQLSFGIPIEEFDEFLAKVFLLEEIGDILKTAGEALKEFFAFEEIGEGIAIVGETVGTFFTETLPTLFEEGMTAAFQLLVTKWEEIKQGWDDLVSQVTSIVSNFFIGIGEGFTTGLETITTTITTFVESTLLTWANFFIGLKDDALIALQGIGLDVTGSLDAVSSTFSDTTAAIAEGWTSFWDNVEQIAQNAVDGAKNIISGALSGIKSIIDGFISGVRSGWSAFWSGLTSAVSSGLSAVRDTASSALELVGDAFDSMSDRVRSIMDALRDFLSGIADSISGIVDRISGFVSSAIDAASNLGNIDLTPFANGGIVDGPTPALVGEAGREVIIPLTRPARAVELARHSGLIDLLTAQGVLAGAGGAVSGPAAPVVGEMHVHSQNADPDQVARKALRLIERRMGGRGLERTS